MLLGQNVNSYGKNLDAPMSFAQLLKEVERIDGIERIRFMTSHPKDLSDELIEVMKDSEKICRHLHLPLQSGSTRILKAMNRRYYEEAVRGFGGKDQTGNPGHLPDHGHHRGLSRGNKRGCDDTVEVIRRVGFDNAFTFIYSPRTGTPAAAMENQVDGETVKEGVRPCIENRTGDRQGTSGAA